MKSKGGLNPPFLLKSLNIYAVMQTIEQQIVNIIQDNLKNLGFDLVKVTLKGSSHKVLEVLIDRLDGKKVNIIDCRDISRNISALLDVEDIISDKYFLEVCSAGIERPLIKFEDYTRFLGREATIKLKELLDGQTRYQGKIVKAEDNKIYLNNNGKDVVLSFDMIKKASLVLTDEMFRNLMNRPLSKLAYAEEFVGDTERRTAAYSNVREDSSTESLSKLYSNDLENWNIKQGVSERSVQLVHEYANSPQFCGTNSSKQKSIPAEVEFRNRSNKKS